MTSCEEKGEVLCRPSREDAYPEERWDVCIWQQTQVQYPNVEVKM